MEGLWGAGTAFKDFGEFKDSIGNGGVGAMELVALDMKRRGMYISRQLSFAGAPLPTPAPDGSNFLQRAAASTIVGIDVRAARASVPSPLRALTSAVNSFGRDAFSRVSNSLVMSAEVGPPRIADVIASKQSFGDESLFPSHVIGDYGFDPLSLATSETLVPFREAELKHGRLAMLAAVAWPLQEILHPILVDAMYSAEGASVTDVLVESNGASPSLLNGGLLQPEVLPALVATVLLGSFLEETDIRKREDLGLAFNEYPNARQPGNLGFDPLNVYRSLSLSSKLGMHERELLNGRVAMMAVLSYVLTEAISGSPVVRATSFLFEPIILNQGFRALMDASFGIASMDGAIDGIAY